MGLLIGCVTTTLQPRGRACTCTLKYFPLHRGVTFEVHATVQGRPVREELQYPNPGRGRTGPPAAPGPREESEHPMPPSLRAEPHGRRHLLLLHLRRQLPELLVGAGPRGTP